MLSDLDLFFGDSNTAEARVYARITGDEQPRGCHLAGRVIGPMCEYSRTLSATIPFLARRPTAETDASLLAEAIVPDPCFWSQELPFLYWAEVELRRGGEVLEAESRTFSIRPLGVRKARLLWESRPWVLRAADCRAQPGQELAAWRAADLAMLVDDASEELCREASRLGVILVAEIGEGRDDIADELRRLARWPAVAMAVVPAGQSFDADVRGRVPNLLLAERFPADQPPTTSPWADLVICEHADADAIAAQMPLIGRPVIAQRPAGWRDDLAEARRACDHLQRDLAARGDFAGYII